MKTPPMIAQIPVRKCGNDFRDSLNFTNIGESSYIKNTPKKKNSIVIE